MPLRRISSGDLDEEIDAAKYDKLRVANYKSFYIARISKLSFNSSPPHQAAHAHRGLARKGHIAWPWCKQGGRVRPQARHRENLGDFVTFK